MTEPTSTTTRASNVELAPDDYLSHCFLAGGLIAAGRDDEAMREIKKSLSLRDDRAVPYCVLASLLTKQGKTEEADKCFERAMILDPDHRTMTLELDPMR
jgi:tetratricopeptide (TPR) repeat protein